MDYSDQQQSQSVFTSLEVRSPAKRKYKLDIRQSEKKDVFVTAAERDVSYPSVDNESGFYTLSEEKRGDVQGKNANKV